jgi:hypothetical protein
MLTRILAAAAAALVASTANGNVLVNEFHYDNDGTDSGEFLEIVSTVGQDISLIDVYLYNGADQQLYSDTGTVGTDIFNVQVHFTYNGTFDGYNYFSLVLPTNGLQNGAPDGIALTFNGALVEFLSYEGTFTGIGSVANGVLSTDIGVLEGSGTPLDSSLQRISFGSEWVATEGSNTKGYTNVPEPGTLALLSLGCLGLIRRRRR